MAFFNPPESGVTSRSSGIRPSGRTVRNDREYTLTESGISRSTGTRRSARRKSSLSVESRPSTYEDGQPKPGDVLRALLLERHGITQDELAAAMRTTRYSVNQVLNNRRAITPEMSLRIAKVTDTSPELWLNLQQQIDLKNAEQALSRELAHIKPLRSSLYEK